MVQLKGKTELATGKDIEEGKTYKITAVEEIKTAVQGYNGLRVVMASTNPKDKETYATVLWLRDRASATSKLGSFISAFLEFFGNEDEAMNTENWVGKTIRVTSWTPKKRTIVVVE